MEQERWREEEKTVIKRRCVNPISSDVFKEFGPTVGKFGGFLW